MRDAPIPTSLTEMQIWFANIITARVAETDAANLPIYHLSVIEEIRKRVAPSPSLKSEERVGIYQQQYWWRLLGIMHEIFPTLVRLFGYGAFNHEIAEPYLVSYPPNDWFLSNLGNALPEWLEKNYTEKDLSLVLGLARLDFAYEKLLFTELLPKIDAQKLPQCEEERMFLQPYVLLFELDVDLFSFRAALLEHPAEHWESNDFPSLDKKRGKRFFILFRHQEKSIYEEISPALQALLARFQQGAKLADLIPLLESSSEIVESFQLIASRGWLTLSNPQSP